MKIFISSVQKEFAAERKALAEYLSGDPLLRRFFETFLFERDVPASDRRPDAVYLDEVAACDLYLGLFGEEYGWENEAGLSPTHLEFNEATRLGKTRLIFVKGATDESKHPKMQILIREADGCLVRRRVNSSEELVAAVYASLVRILEERELIRLGPFDATFCRNASLDDLDEDKITRFLGLARRGRNFPLPEDTPPREVLAHLNLFDKGQPTHAAILLFGKQPQRFLITSEVKCAHFHGTEVAKPIPSYQVYKGTVFDLVDQAKDFVLSKIDLWVGTREESTQVPTNYEIPQEVVPKPIHPELRISLFPLCAKAMKMVLVNAAIDLVVPKRSPPNRTAFADKQIVRAKFEACLLCFAEVHLIEVCQLESIPENVLGSKKRALVLAVTISL